MFSNNSNIVLEFLNEIGMLTLTKHFLKLVVLLVTYIQEETTYAR